MVHFPDERLPQCTRSNYLAARFTKSFDAGDAPRIYVFD